MRTAEAKALIDNAYLIPKWEVALRRDALIINAHASTAIEGNLLSIEQVSELAKGRDIMATRKAKAEVLNYLNALEDLPNISESGKITENVLPDNNSVFHCLLTCSYFYHNSQPPYFPQTIIYTEKSNVKKLCITIILEFYGVSLKISSIVIMYY